jgi:hypothetical protein
VDPRDLTWCQLQVVRLRARGREVPDVDRRASDSLGGVGEGIERRLHRLPSSGASRPAACEDSGQDKNENYSRKHVGDDTLRT